MNLSQDDIDFIKAHLVDWLSESEQRQGRNRPPTPYDIDLRERMIRVEEELSHQRELMREGFSQMDKRIEQADKRFEQVDKRFEQVDKRFEQVDKRFDQVDKHFDLAERRQQELRQDMLSRFEVVQQDIRELQRRTDRFLVWSFSTVVAVGGLVVSLVKFWNP